VPFVDHLGFELVDVGAGHCTLGASVRPELTNRWGVAHGGAIMSLLDMTMGMSAKSLDPEAIGATTVELKVNFLAVASGEIVAAGQAQRAGRSLVFVEGEVRDAAGAVLAKGTGTFKLRHTRAAG
jgi:uncharacterized protein (TIGR00369 family)